MIELLENVDLEGFVVIIPSISVGNVGQLASDLLIYSLNLKKLGYVRHPCALPLAGADPFNWSNAPSLGCELYYSSSLKLIVFQIRTAITRSDSFTQDLCTWLKSVKVKQVVILAGSSAHERRDKQLIQEPLRYVFCPLTGAKETENAKRRNWIELENKDVANLSSKKSLSYIPGINFIYYLNFSFSF